MKKLLLRGSVIVAIIFALSCGVAYAATGTIDPNNTGNFKAQIQNASLGANTTVNFGKFTTQSTYNIRVSNTALTGYAWGDGIGWVIVNCIDTPTGCTTTNGKFKVANDGDGNLSGYAWGENTGWINFGPFSNPAISTVKIGADGKFGGTLGDAGYAWTQNYGWMLFDCTVTDACVETDWRKGTTSTGGGSGGGGGTTTTPICTLMPALCVTPVTQPTQPSVTPPTNPSVTPPAVPPTTSPTTPSTNPGSPVTPTITTSNGGTIPVNFPAPSNFFKTSGWNIGSKVMSGLGIAAAALAPLIGALFLNPLSFYDIGLLIGRLWTLLLVAFGLKKRTPPWGVVYDSVTKQPLDPAYVVLTDMEGNEIATSITDIDGRYGFLVGPGVYKLMANKSNYNFPSVKLAGKNSDELYGDLYFGETIEVTQEGGIIAKNIPLDQLNFDWNEFAKKERALTSFYHHRDVVIARVADILFVIGFIFSAIAVLVSATTYNICIIALYVLILVLKRLGIRAKPRGEVYEGYTRDPLPFSIVRVLSTATGVEVAHRVSNRMGTYYCLISNGEYKIVVDKKNPDGTYTKVPIETPVVVDKGYIKKDFRL